MRKENERMPRRLGAFVAPSMDEEEMMRRAGAVTTDEETIEILAEEPDSRIRLKVAANPATPVHVLEELARDVDPEVRMLVAASRHTPIAVLRMQLYDMNPYVKRMAINSLALARFKNCSRARPIAGVKVTVPSQSSFSNSASRMPVGACW
ncbi:MAG: hypothetical protein IPM23_24890 [Candidatus Melainabacteria bacterium]|nr:hypothetical protein [Candidatus Melainabacteria bacterium]